MTITAHAMTSEFTSKDFLELANRLYASLDYSHSPAGCGDPCVALHGDFSPSWLRGVAETLLGAERGAQLISEASMSFTVTGVVAYWPTITNLTLFAIPGVDE